MKTRYYRVTSEKIDITVKGFLAARKVRTREYKKLIGLDGYDDMSKRDVFNSIDIEECDDTVNAYTLKDLEDLGFV